MKTRCLKCGEEHRTDQCTIKEKINNPTCINCNAKGHMASSTECPLFPKPRKGKGQTPKDNKKRNEITQANAALITPGLSFAQAIQSKNSQQRTARDQEPFLIASIYAPPNHNYRNLGADFDALFQIFKTAIVAGDCNAKHTSWGCVSSDPRGNYLLRYITNNKLDLIAPPTPTRYGTDSASTLDYALIKNLNWTCTADSLAELSSDHNPIRFYFPRTPKFQIPPPELNTTWSIFTKILANPDNFDLPKANSTQEIDSQGELKELIKDRNKAKKTWQQTIHPQHETELNRIQNIIKRKIYHYRQQAWEDNLSTLNAEDNSLWGIAKAFRKNTSPISDLNGPTDIALSDRNKTEVIAHSLESQFQLNNIHNPHKDEVITSVVHAYIERDSNINNTDTIPPHSSI
ncbi:probable RNA-directed DNA polymerase from transposon X-element [Trichonephila clavipes]|uniref:Probable RNA-directed DNA polymerase from transposon X-element n=1 Tax=Trichonephila clavipes TaxID=2585209 RepID=A0A8X6R583_TRICX|nr:probable RNA-directed DNA polymerase from transposon X-element [Trichonephila clavipes]